ncbi:MAG TPA: hypothetical protein ENI74_09005 [Gammaproteobacteria bacterium]|nr:hypothetical protein [Gammaproteobacteria bacterium]
MRVMHFIRLWCCVFGLAGFGTVSAVDVGDDDDLYNEGYNPGYIGEPESRKKEDTVIFPSWPSDQDLVRVDLSLVEFPYTLLIDEKSFSVGSDSIIRYTAILRSADGVDNITYEGISCNRREVRRYAYGSRGRFRPVRKSEWKYILNRGQDRYRYALVENYFCPLPSGDVERQLLDNLKTNNRYR